MKLEHKIILGMGVAIVAAAVVWEARAGMPKTIGSTEITKESLLVGLQRPAIWLFYNDSEVNSRNWSDFMARGSRVINIPLLNLCYQTIVAKNGDKYRIEVVAGLQGVAERLGGWDKLPESMRNPKGQVSVAEEDWIRTAILKKYGGLWLSPSSVCIRGFGDLPNKVVGFGQDDVPLYGSSVPGFRCLWSPIPNHPIFVEWERRIRERIDNQLGGRQFRGDAKSDWVEITTMDIYAEDAVEIYRLEELARDQHNKSLDLEKIFAAGTEGRLPFTIPSEAMYMPIPYNDLLNRRHFGWILRSSEEQIMESDLAIRYILEKSL